METFFNFSFILSFSVPGASVSTILSIFPSAGDIKTFLSAGVILSGSLKSKHTKLTEQNQSSLGSQKMKRIEE